MIDLKDKVIVITGATSGLGASLAEEFLNKGSKVISLSNSEPENINSQVAYINCDITDSEKVFSEIKNIEKTFGTIDIFVNNAGVWVPHAPIEEQTKENIQKMINVNLFGTVFCTQAVLPIFKKKRSGVLLNIVSISALEPNPVSSGYAASKFAQDGFTKATREAVKDNNIKVINVYPEGIKTNLFDGKKPDNYDKYMDPSEVSKKIIDFLLKEKGEEIIIRRD
ncbi:MAG: SDR family oxidoreductase [Candidatus Paceibacterota bacterium]